MHHLDERSKQFDFDLDDLLHPAQAFAHPSEVVSDPDLTLNEKRAILASWASDACAVDSAPALRHGGPGRPPIGFDDVMEALRMLDKQASAVADRYRRRRRIFRGRRRDDGFGSTPLQA
jgi:hypothetical protein